MTCAILGVHTTSVVSPRGRGGEAGGTWLPQALNPWWRVSPGKQGRLLQNTSMSESHPMCPVSTRDQEMGRMGNHLGVQTTAGRFCLCSNLILV